MSIALESATRSRIERSGLQHHGMAHGAVYDSPDSGRPVFGIFPGDHRVSAAKNLVVVEDREEESTSTSSIGVNSDTSGGTQSDGERDSDEIEVQSSFKGPIDSLEALEEVLPIKRSMSKFYNGKSKSFTSLAEAAYCRSIKDIVKPEDAYTRKRKNLLAHSIFWDKNPIKPSRTGGSSDDEGGLLKKPANTSRNNLGMAIGIIDSNSNSNEYREHSSASASASASPVRSRPPLHPQSRKSSSPPPQELSLPLLPLGSTASPRGFSAWRSFSLSDLQCAAAGDGNVKLRTSCFTVEE